MAEDYVKYVYIGVICMLLGVVFYFFAEPLNQPELCKKWVESNGTSLLLNHYDQGCLDQLPQRIEYFRMGGIVLAAIGAGLWVRGLLV